MLVKKLRNGTLKKLIKDIDVASQGSSLGPVLANIIMMELEKIVVSDLINFYIRYINDTLLLAKKDDIYNIVQQFNAFDDNLKFTIDKFTVFY